MIYFVSLQKRLFNDPEIKVVHPQDCLNYFKYHQEIEIDSETYGFDPYTKNTVCWQIGDYNNQFVIETASYSIELFKELLESKLLILQNAQFDLRFLYHKNIFPNKIYDIMLVEAIMTTGLGDVTDISDIKKDCNKKEVAEHFANRKLGLNDISQKYLGVEISKDLRGTLHKEGLTDRIIRYSATDVKYLGKIKEAQLKEFEAFKQKYRASDSLIDLENNAVKVFSRLLYNGIKLDVPFYKKEVVSVVNREVESITTKLNEIVRKSNIRYITTINNSSKKQKSFEIVFGGDLFNPNACNINWNSPEQKLGILQKFDNTLTDTSKVELTKRTNKHEIFNTAIEYSKFKKLKDSFGEPLLNFVNPVTGRIHAQIWQILSTGRISMSEPNLAQIPSKGNLGKTIRQGFIPRSKDYVIVGGDYSGRINKLI